MDPALDFYIHAEVILDNPPSPARSDISEIVFSAHPSMENLIADIDKAACPTKTISELQIFSTGSAVGVEHEIGERSFCFHPICGNMMYHRLRSFI